MLSLSKLSRIWVLLGVTFAAGTAIRMCAQNSGAGQGEMATYPVRGVVLNSLTRQPIARALVDGNFSAVLTDGEGRFELNLPEGMIPITTRRPTFNSRGQDMQHLVHVGANMPDLAFYLTPQASIAGQVTFSTGEEADGVRLMAYKRSNINGREKWMTAGTVTTNSEGEFHFSNLETPGSYVICSMSARDGGAVRAPVRSGSVLRTDFGYPGVCYPGPIPAFTDISSTSVLQISPGQQAQVELPLTRQPFYHVSIVVPNAGHSQGGGVQIHDFSGRVLEFGTKWNPQQGLAEVYLPNGRYYADYSRARFGDQAASYGRVDFQVVNGPISGLSLALLPLHPIQVQIRKEFTNTSQNGAQGVTVFGPGQFNGHNADPGINLTLTSADGLMWDTGGSGLSQPRGSPDGLLFEIETAVPGRYWVQPFAYEGYINSITSGGVDLTREPLVIGPGSTVAPIQVTLRNDGGQINCTVNAGPSAGSESGSGTGLGTGSSLGEISMAYVYAIPLSRTPSQIPQMPAPRNEPFTIPNLAPGSYRVVAFDKYQEFNVSDPQDLARIVRGGQTVTVTAGTTTSVQLDVVQTGAEAGQTGSAGEPEL